MLVSISGSWRKINNQVIKDVESEINRLHSEGKGIVSGGALGVDFVATAQALKLNIPILVILPTSFEIFRTHFKNAVQKGVITEKQHTDLMTQLKIVRDSDNTTLREMHFKVCNPETYYARNQEVIDSGQELIAFHVNESQGVQDAIDRARHDGKPVKTYNYEIK